MGTLIMGAALVMVISLALLLSLVFLLLAEFYCSLLLRHRHRHPNKPPAPTSSPSSSAAADDPEDQMSTQQHQQQQPPYSPLSLCSFYYQGVLPAAAPSSFLFPSGHHRHDDVRSRLPDYYSPVSSSAACPIQQPYSPASSAATTKDHLIYICNPVYDVREPNVIKADTPFETPGTSPSQLEAEEESPSGSSSSRKSISSSTPPLTPMKKLPAEGPSVSLRNAGSICTTGSESNNSINYYGAISSSSSDSQKSTSPSW